MAAMAWQSEMSHGGPTVKNTLTIRPEARTTMHARHSWKPRLQLARKVKNSKISQNNMIMRYHAWKGLDMFGIFWNCVNVWKIWKKRLHISPAWSCLVGIANNKAARTGHLGLVAAGAQLVAAGALGRVTGLGPSQLFRDWLHCTCAIHAIHAIHYVLYCFYDLLISLCVSSFCYFASWPRTLVFYVNSCFSCAKVNNINKMSIVLTTSEKLKRCKVLAFCKI